MNIIYRQFAANNTAQATEYAKYVNRLTMHYWGQAGMQPTANPITARVLGGLELQQKARDELEKARSSGICGGMVCAWALGYLHIGDHLIHQKLAEDLQGRAIGRILTNHTVKHVPEAQAISAARKKMYDFVNLALSPSIRSSFPIQKPLYQKQVALTIFDQLGLHPRTPHLMLLEIATGPHPGNHAIGLVLDGGHAYVLEPNQGLYRFPKAEFSTEMATFFVSAAKVASPWELFRITRSR